MASKRGLKTPQTIVIDDDERPVQLSRGPTKKIKTKSYVEPRLQSIPEKQMENPYSGIVEAPTVELTDEQMKQDPVKLFVGLEEKYQHYGAVKVRASPNWQPPFCFGFRDKGITTRIQKIHKLSLGKVGFFIYSMSTGSSRFFFSKIHYLSLFAKSMNNTTSRAFLSFLRISRSPIDIELTRKEKQRNPKMKWNIGIS